MGVVLDSTVVIAGERHGVSAADVLATLRLTLGPEPLVLSTISVVELEHGIWRAKDAGRAARRRGSPDRLGGKLASPTSLNRYSYVQGDPVNAFDPMGLCATFIAGFTSNYNQNTDFTQIATAAGADQAYPYSGLSFSQSTQNWGGTVATQAARSAVLDALQNNSGKIDIVAWSGGAATFTNVYNSLSASQQARIGNIIYIGPANPGTLASNSTTTVLNGSDWKDMGATFATVVPMGVNSIPTSCNHEDIACFLQQQQTLFSRVQDDGSCNNPHAYTRSGRVNTTAWNAPIAQTGMQNQIDSFLDWVLTIPVGGTGYEVSEKISYDLGN